MGKIRNFLCFLYVLYILIVRLRRNKSPTGKFGYCICYILYILRHRRNDVDSIIIEELAYYCFPAIFYTPYSSDLFAFAKHRIVIRFISFHNSFIKNKKIKIARVYHSFHN